MAVRKLLEKVAKVIKPELIDDGALRTNHYAAKSIPETAYGDATVSTRALGTKQVTEPKLADQAVSGRALANESVSIDKLDQALRSKGAYGLSNVDNTSDANKPVSGPQQQVFDQKQNKLPTGDSSQYLRGDLTMRRLSSVTVLSQDDLATGNLDSITAPGIYQYASASSLPGGAASTGTLQVYANSTQGRSQVLVDVNAYVWTRSFNGTSWSGWLSSNPGGIAQFYGTSMSQVHTAQSEERARYNTASIRGMSNTAGQISFNRAGKYSIQITATGAWRADSAGAGRKLRIQQNGITVAETFTDVPVVWGNGLGAFSMTTQAFLVVSANDTVEGRLSHDSNKTITVHHYAEIRMVD